MTKFNEKIGAAVLLSFGLIYMIIALATGHNAQALPAAQLDSKDAAMDIWQVLHTMNTKQAKLIDIRKDDRFQLFPLTLANNIPEADVADIAKQVSPEIPVIIISEKEKQAQQLVQKLRQTEKENSYFLKGGLNSWYLNIEVPVPLFSSKSAPYGYNEAIRTVKDWIHDPAAIKKAQLEEALQHLSNHPYQADQLAGKKKPSPSKKRKKISGGCG